jgi:hypothetical protein
MITVSITDNDGVPAEIDFKGIWQERDAVEFLADAYPEMTVEQRKAIRVSHNGLKTTNATMLKVEQLVSELGWAVLEPVAQERPSPHCPMCNSGLFIKIGRYPDNKCMVKCQHCRHEAALTNGEYYTDICDADQE